MGESVKVTKQSAPEVVEVARRAFPDYRGRKFRVAPFDRPRDLISGWDGGTRSQYRVVPLVAGSSAGSFEVPENGTFPLQNDGRKCMLSELPEGLALVQHTIFCGHDIGIIVYVSPANFNSRMLAEKVVS